MSWTVYFLIDPRDGEIHYVGCSGNLAARFNGHMTDARFHIKNPKWIGKASRKQRWIADLIKKGLKPLMVPLITTEDPDERVPLEETWIRRMGLAGCDLLIGPKGREKMLADGIITPHEHRDCGKIEPYYVEDKVYIPVTKIWRGEIRA